MAFLFLSNIPLLALCWNNSDICLVEELRGKNFQGRSSTDLSIHVQQCCFATFNKVSWTGGWAVGHATHWPGDLAVQSVHIMLWKKPVLLMLNRISCFCLLDPGAYRRKQNRMGWWSMSFYIFLYFNGTQLPELSFPTWMCSTLYVMIRHQTGKCVFIMTCGYLCLEAFDGVIQWYMRSI